MDQRSDPSLEAALADDRERAVALNVAPVSRETWARLDVFIDLLLKWQRTTNLIAPSTIPTIWTRHVADSLQLLPLAPDGAHWVDLGSGGGFPGVVIACALAERPHRRIDLVESNQKKARFLSQVIRLTEVPAVVHATRIEDFVVDGSVDVATARAVAPLDRLLGLANPLLKTGAVGLFPKGQDVEVELTEAAKSWTIDAELIPSKTDPRGRILRIRHSCAKSLK